MGDKVKARQIMKSVGVPVVPGSEGVLGSELEVLKVAELVGYPFMLKAVAGGSWNKRAAAGSFFPEKVLGSSSDGGRLRPSAIRGST